MVFYPILTLGLNVSYLTSLLLSLLMLTYLRLNSATLFSLHNDDLFSSTSNHILDWGNRNQVALNVQRTGIFLVFEDILSTLIRFISMITPLKILPFHLFGRTQDDLRWNKHIISLVLRLRKCKAFFYKLENTSRPIMSIPFIFLESNHPWNIAFRNGEKHRHNTRNSWMFTELDLSKIKLSLVNSRPYFTGDQLETHVSSTNMCFYSAQLEFCAEDAFRSSFNLQCFKFGIKKLSIATTYGLWPSWRCSP